MLRLTDIKLPLDHAEGAITAAILTKLAIRADALRGHTVARRSYDARKRGAIVVIYALDVDVADEATVLVRRADAARSASSRAAGRRTRSAQSSARTQRSALVRRL